MNLIEKIKGFEKFASTGVSPEQIEKFIISVVKDKKDNFSIEDIIKSYENYMKWWEAKFYDREEKYISKEDRAVTFRKFVFTNMYNNIYEIGKSKIEKYLFGNHNANKIEKFVISFERKHKL